ncbi:hypothetical protein P4268_28125 [Bacillus thuringiensis]|nr:hypothetical protein [Bacillus thuringiensis]
MEVNILKNIERKFISNYDLGDIIETEINKVGWGTNYIFKTKLGKFFVKIFELNKSNNNSLHEILICNYLREKGYPVSKFVKNRKGEYISKLDFKKSFHVQEFIEGDIWKKNTAPNWLLEQGCNYIGRIHNELKQFDLNLRPSIKLLNDKNYHIKRIEGIINQIKKMQVSEDTKLFIEDLENRRDVISNSEIIDMSKLTFVNGHSDYSVTQIITSNNNITGIIDMTEVSKIPAIWELMRFYLNSIKERNDGRICVNELSWFLENYMNVCSLSKYDLLMMYKLNYLYMCQAVSVYEKFICTKDVKFANRAKLRINKINKFKNCQDDLQNIISKLNHYCSN